MPEQTNLSDASAIQDKMQEGIRSSEKRNQRIAKVVIEVATSLVSPNEATMMGHILVTAPKNFAEQLTTTERRLSAEKRNQGTFSDEQWTNFKTARTLRDLNPQDTASLLLATDVHDDYIVKTGDATTGEVTETRYVDNMEKRHPSLLSLLRSFTPSQKAGILAQNCLHYGNMGAGELGIAIQPHQLDLLNKATRLIGEVHSPVDNPKK